MTLDEYRAKLKELMELPYAEHLQKVSELEAEYLAQQTVPDAESAVGAIAVAWYGGVQICETVRAPNTQVRSDAI